uniref:Uncharacterized protein n=1 Tax=Timema monikensis TaxID=170555 RepID=A0A7R9HK66_9NEOP|nr:unnamed protein product [Timema monikensis]
MRPPKQRDVCSQYTRHARIYTSPLPTLAINERAHTQTEHERMQPKAAIDAYCMRDGGLGQLSTLPLDAMQPGIARTRSSRLPHTDSSTIDSRLHRCQL